MFAARHVESGEAVALKVLSSTTAMRLYRVQAGVPGARRCRASQPDPIARAGGARRRSCVLHHGAARRPAVRALGPGRDPGRRAPGHRAARGRCSEGPPTSGSHELCVEVVFGRAQAENAHDDPAGDAAIEDLTRWALSRADHARIGHWYCESLLARFRHADCVEFGTRALTLLGVRIPRRPSWPRAMLSHARGMRALRGSGCSASDPCRWSPMLMYGRAWTSSPACPGRRSTPTSSSTSPSWGCTVACSPRTGSTAV